MSVSAFIFFILYVKPIRSLLIQPAGSTFRLLAETFYIFFQSLLHSVTEFQTGPHGKYLLSNHINIIAWCFELQMRGTRNGRETEVSHIPRPGLLVTSERREIDSCQTLLGQPSFSRRWRTMESKVICCQIYRMLSTAIRKMC